jgi:mannosyl-3-phosphoglycerate phosphatase
MKTVCSGRQPAARIKMKALFFSDIDGTFLDYDNYCYKESIKGVELLKEKSIPLIFISSKTFDEMMIIANELYLNYPFSFENGTGFAYPTNERGKYNIELEGPGADELLKFLPMLEKLLMKKLRAINSLSEDEMFDITKLDAESAYRAKNRMTTLPFIADGDRLLSDTEIDKINILLQDYSLSVIKGGRFNHLIPSNNGKGKAVKKIIEFYKCKFNDEILTASAGDSQSDISMFESTDFSYIIRRPDRTFINYINGNIMKSPGPAGFSEAVYDFLNTKVNLWRH